MKPIYLKIVIIAGILSLACTTKVSEWVLLNSLPTDYTLIYFHKDPLSETEKQQNTEAGKNIISGNIQFRNILKKDINQSFYGLYYKNRLFSKYNDIMDLKNLTTSPLREKIAMDLKEGKLTVLVYLKTDIKEKDEAGLQIVKKTIAASPFGSIIPVIELSRNNLDEKHFISMLLNVESDLKDIKEPMLFGIFGRFKALEPLLAKGITEENINLMINYLSADCSCLIKDNLPGTDILFTNDWENPAPALVNKILDENPSLLHI
jgi:hypothetical protein